MKQSNNIKMLKELGIEEWYNEIVNSFFYNFKNLTELFMYSAVNLFNDIIEWKKDYLCYDSYEVTCWSEMKYKEKIIYLCKVCKDMEIILSKQTYAYFEKYHDWLNYSKFNVIFQNKKRLVLSKDLVDDDIEKIKFKELLSKSILNFNLHSLESPVVPLEDIFVLIESEIFNDFEDITEFSEEYSNFRNRQRIGDKQEYKIACAYMQNSNEFIALNELYLQKIMLEESNRPKQQEKLYLKGINEFNNNEEFMNWDDKNRRWRRYEQGQRYVVTCKQLGLPEKDWTQHASRMFANAWWQNKIANI